jgi:hypothetical protein
VVAGCLGDSTAPRHGEPAPLSLAPVFETHAALVVSFDRVRITLTRSSGTALDTTVAFPPGADSLVLSLDVPIIGSSETLSLSLAMIDAAGDTVFRGGPEPVTVSVGVAGTGTSVPVPIRYVGVGSNARSVRIATKAASVFFRDSVLLSATALDSSGRPIVGTPIAWRSLDINIAQVRSDTSGEVFASTTRGVARIEAILLTNQADTALVTVQPVPAAIGVISGGGQTGAVGAALAQPVVVRVKAADSLGLQGVVVNFNVLSGGGSLSKAADTTNANGDATTSWTLGTAPGAQSLGAAVKVAPSLTATVPATAAAGAATRLAIQVQPSSAAAGAAIAPAIQVVAQDGFGNTATAFTGNVTVAVSGGTAGAALRGAATVAAVAGVATFTDLSVDSVGTGYTLTASATGLTGATSTAFAITSAPASKVVFTSEPPTSAASGAGFSLAVTARDSLGNRATAFTGNVTVAISGGSGKAGASLRGATTVAAVAGIATFSGLSVDSVGTGYTLTATSTGLTSGTSSAFAITAAPASKLAFTTEPPASSVAGTAFGAAVTARDSLGNTATSFTGNVTVAITGGTGKTGAALRGTATVAAVAGVASFSGLSVDSAGTGYTLTATASGLANGTSSFFAITAAPAVRLAFAVQPPASSTAGVGFGAVVAAKDSLGNTVTGFAGNVNLTLSGGTTGAALRGTTTVAAASGVATFTGLSVDSLGTGYTLTATASGLANGTSSAFAITAAPASRLAFSTQPPASSVYQVGFGFAVTARDSLGNKVTTFTGPVTVAIGTNPASGTLSGTLTQNAVAGVATFSGVSLDNIGTGYTLSAGATGLTSGTSAAFNIVAPAGWDVWINRSGGNWSVAGNWSKGAVPAATDTVGINQSGTYTVSFNTSTGTFARMAVGAPLGAQTFSVDTTTLNVPAGGATFGTTGVLALSNTGTIIGAGTIAVSGAFNWTGGNLGAIGGPAGSLQVLSGGTMSIAAATQTALNNYTLILAGTGTWGTGAVPITNSGNGAIFRVAVGGVLNVTGTSPSISRNLGGSAVLHNLGTINRTTGAGSFVVNDSVSGNGSWNVQSGSVNLQLPGTISGPVTVSAGAALNFFLLANNLTFDATSSLSGGGAVLVSASTGTARFAGAYNITGRTTVSGGTALFAGATGSVAALTVNGGTFADSGAFSVSGATTWSSGTISVIGTGSRLRLAGGSATSFGGTANVATGDTLDLAGGTFTLTSNLSVTGGGALVVSGGTLVLNGFTASLAGNFATLSTGTLTMTNAKDTLAVSGSATFGGGSTAGLLSAGIITLNRNFAQSGNASSYAPTLGGTHRLSLRGTVAESISMANPAAAQSHFDVLEIQDASRGVVLQTNTFVNDTLWMQAGSAPYSLTGAGTTQRLTTAGLIRLDQSTGSPRLAPPVVELSVTPTITPSGGFNPDTTVFLGGITSLPTGVGFAYKNVRVNSTGTFSAPGSNVTFNGSVIISSGTFAFTAATDSIGGFLRTEATGALSMTGTVAAPTIAVRDSAVFAGGASTSLSAGLLRVHGNFVQRGTAGQFAASGAHRTLLNKTTTGVQTILFADSVNSFFNILDLNRPTVDTVRLLSNVLVNDSAIVSGSSILTSTSLEALKTPKTGAVRVHSGGVLRPSRVEIGLWGNASADSTFLGGPVRIMPDTAVFLGIDTITSSGTPYGWKSARAAGDTLVTYGTTYNGNLIMSGGMYTFPICCNGTDSVKGFLRTEGTGTLRLNSGDGTYNLVVRDSAVFSGGDETGLLVNSNLYVGGNFIQRGDSTTFQADPYMTTIFNGSGTQTVTFGSPGASLSRFGTLQMARTSPSLQNAGITLLSNIFLSGFIYDTSNVVTDSIAGQGHTVTAAGLELFGSKFVMNNAPLVTNSTSLSVSGLTFRNMSTSITQWTIHVPSAAIITMSNVNFLTTPTTGMYFAAQADTVGVSLTFNLPLTPTFAALNGTTFYKTINGAFTTNVVWGGSALTNR